MAIARQLSRAPITEALIDIRVRPQHGFQATEFEALKPVLKDRFANVEPRRVLKTQIQFKPGVAPDSSAEDLGIQGMLFKTADGKTVAQYRVDGFTLNRLSPYTSWDQLRSEALDLWQRYAEIAHPELVTRIALRYIDRIEVPPGVADLGALLVSPPRIPPGFPPVMRSFLTSVLVEDPSTQILATVTQALEAPVSEAPAALILDFDVHKRVELVAGDAEIAQTLERLRTVKNALFFSSVTDEALRAYE